MVSWQSWGTVGKWHRRSEGRSLPDSQLPVRLRETLSNFTCSASSGCDAGGKTDKPNQTCVCLPFTAVRVRLLDLLCLCPDRQTSLSAPPAAGAPVWGDLCFKAGPTRLVSTKTQHVHIKREKQWTMISLEFWRMVFFRRFAGIIFYIKINILYSLFCLTTLKNNVRYRTWQIHWALFNEILFL